MTHAWLDALLVILWWFRLGLVASGSDAQYFCGRYQTRGSWLLFFNACWMRLAISWVFSRSAWASRGCQRDRNACLESALRSSAFKELIHAMMLT